MLLLFMLLLACFWPKRVQNAIFSLRVAEATRGLRGAAGMGHKRRGLGAIILGFVHNL